MRQESLKLHWPNHVGLNTVPEQPYPKRQYLSVIRRDLGLNTGRGRGLRRLYKSVEALSRSNVPILRGFNLRDNLKDPEWEAGICAGAY